MKSMHAIKLITAVAVSVLLFGLVGPIVLAYETTPINCWRGQNSGADCTTGTDRNKPFWSGDDTYGWDVYFDTHGDTMCVQWKVGSGSYDQTACSYVDGGNHWFCSFNAGPVSSQTVTFEFYNDNDNDASGACKPIQGDAVGWSGEKSFTTGTNAVTLRSIQASPVAAALPVAGVLAGLGGLGGLAFWRRRR